ncbi:MAG: 16S rRNA (cytosine(967)-C(5))-methyltransferase RsmB [Rivihabitans pingtungensis]|jgi:16S rRNA (cytosine967-C5)-methyltransferase|uniref:16S rRNA (cytosine(967)-C(5))-methyltransferase RsmB n=1 Tax=Rivihabitans pingtungensis TaxID=1054498 RepID=UPI002CC1EF73|nr:16S rRNA (cytosine(967)-C(5))-methyltransferase RsmB [Rivihabitans pingtungensis]HNX71342.1 16S rRNA (cytosine(967)-C(5))-methyltransferase RsmB [Rivihabitans pingtungensis]
MQTIQTLAAHILDTVLSGKNLTDTLATAWRQHPALAPAERAAVMDITHGALRHYGWLRGALDKLLSRPLTDSHIDRLLIVALYQLEHTQAAPYAIVDHAVRVASAHEGGRLKGLTNAVLRNFQRRHDELAAALRREPTAFWNHPDWWVGAVQQAYPKDWKAILTASNQHPPMTVRVNRRRLSVADWLTRLQEAGLEGVVLEGDAVRLVKPVPVDKLPGFAEGDVSVQDAGAQLAADWLEVADGMRVLDACAAPGGKTCHLLERAQLDLTAVDNDAHRLQRVQSNLTRLGLSARCLTGDASRPKAWWDGQMFDRVLADVPCSASGVARRHPDIKWTRRPTDIPSLGRQQGALADALWALVAPGGKMLYATCSIFPTENRRQIDAFLTRHVNAELERDIQLLPDENHDGFYYALIRKT